MVTDGKHPGRLDDIRRFTTEDGKDAVSFVFRLEDTDETVSYGLTLIDSRGLKNIYPIQLTLRWAPEWDCQDLDWFAAHLTECRLRPLLLTVRGNLVEWIAKNEAPTFQPKELPPPPASRRPDPQTTRTGLHIRLAVNRDKLSELPERIHPDFQEAKALFDILTEGTDKLDADFVWTRLAASIGPLQIDFGEAEWQRMIDRIKDLRSWEGNVNV